MAINSIPGVGPQNSDIANATAAVVPNSAAITAAVPTAAQIATAVAAPSAATIAAAVAAPSAATIAAAVAAPSSATIASAVAAAVPTLTQINTSVSSNAPSPFAWTVISTQTPNATATSYTFSSLSGYKAYKILFNTTMSGGTGTIYLNINGDTTSTYQLGNVTYGSTVSGNVSVNNANIPITSAISNGTWVGAETIIENANTAAHKTVKYVSASGAGTSFYYNGYGSYRTTSTISSITVSTQSAVTFNQGSIILLGAN